MEIFQTIWTALTTPNENMINILSIPLAFVEITVVMLLFHAVLNISSTKKQKLIYVISLSLWTILSNLVIHSSLLSLFNILIFLVVAFLVFKLSPFKSILAEVISLIVIAVLDPIFINIIMYFFNISYEEIATIPIFRLLFLSLLYLSIYLLYRLLKYLRFNITLLDDMSKKTRNIIIMNSIIGIIAIFLQRYLSNYYSNDIPIILVSISTITLLIYFCMSMYSLIRTTKLERTEQSLEEAQLYNKSLKILHDNVRAFKHDFSNIVQAIGRIC